MKTHKVLQTTGLLLAALMLAGNAHAQSVQSYSNVNDVFDPTIFNNVGGYTTGDLSTAPGTTLGQGANAVEFELSLANSITLNDLGAGYNYGFFMGGFNPLIPNGADVFTFSVELLDEGTLVSPDIAFDLANPFQGIGGYDTTNPFGDVDNIGSTTSTNEGNLTSSLTFDQINILVSNSEDLDGGQGTTDFSFQIGPNQPSQVPDGGATVSMLACAFAGVAALRRRFAK